ncbi:MAG: SGNH/GDSL hydrolase family protein [Bacteroidota bacterium]
MTLRRCKIIVSVFIAFLLVSCAHHDMQLILPPEICCSPYTETSVYYENILHGFDNEDCTFRFSPELGAGDSIKYTFNIKGRKSRNYNLTINAFNKAGTKTGKGKTKVCYTVADKKLSDTLNVLMTGNSLTNAGIYATSVKKLCQDNMHYPIHFIGTKEAKGGGIHEGYGGKTWEWFSNNFESPFVFHLSGSDTTLNFKHYFENVVKYTPDFVVIELGINDCFRADTTSVEAIDKSIDEMFMHTEYYLTQLIHYNSNIQIGICLTPAPNKRKEAFYANYGEKYTQTGWTKIHRRLNQRYIEYFDNNFQSNCSIIPLDLHIDTYNSYPLDNGVHPNKDGYQQIASCIFNWLINKIYE